MKRIVLSLVVLLSFTVPAFAQALPDFSNIVERYSSAVVNISTTALPPEMPERGMAPAPSPFQGTPFEQLFEQFFQGLPQGQAPVQPGRSLGSGLVISADGYVVTNNHVVEGADEIIVRFADETEHKAKLVGRDTKNDIALLKVDNGNTLPYAPLGDSSAVKVGEWVLAIGNPFGLGGSVSAGIISARGRQIGGAYDDFLQTDAAINPGNSGGPLFNLNGDVIGINTAILTRSGGSNGIGFAIPSNTVKNIVEQIKEHGRPIRGWLGVRIQTVTDELAKALKLDRAYGALVAEVVVDSPAAKVGLKTGDVIVSYDGRTINKMSDLPRLVAETKVNNTVKVEYIRGGKKQTANVLIAELSEEGDDNRPVGKGQRSGGDAVLGMRLQNLDDNIRRQLGVDKSVRGAVIAGVAAGSDAERAGLRRGDIVLQVGNAEVTSADQAKRLLEADKSGTVLLLINRSGDNLFVPLVRAEKK